jgi:hypothetical protein
VIIIFGIRRLRKGMGPLLLRCANCGMSPVVLFRVSTWFALFFIPVIPLSFKHYVACPNCKRLDPASKADVDRARAQEATINAGGHAETVDVQRQPATLEHAVNELASAGQAHGASSEPGPLMAPASFVGDASPPPLPPAGWYPDPGGRSSQRYWDGQRWTEHTTPTPSSP